MNFYFLRMGLLQSYSMKVSFKLIREIRLIRDSDKRNRATPQRRKEI